MSYSNVTALLKNGVSRPTLYKVTMPLRSAKSQNANDQLEFLVKTTAVPQVAVTTLASNGHLAMGVVQNTPARVEFAKPFSITVISDRDYTVYQEVRAWFETVTSNNGSNPKRYTAGQPGQVQRMNYYDNVVRTITLEKLEQNGETFVKNSDGIRKMKNGMYTPWEIQFNNAYPVRLGDINLQSDAYDTAMQFDLDFTYETYTFYSFDDAYERIRRRQQFRANRGFTQFI